MTEGTLSSLFTEERGRDPPWDVVCFGASQQLTDRLGQIFPKWPPPEKSTAAEYSRELASNVFLPQQVTFSPVFPGGPPRTAVNFDPDSH